jgi:hypothetical protein
MRKRTPRPAPTLRNTAPKTAPSWNYYVAATAVCCVLVAGFFLAARQHFSSIDFGIKNSRLRRQLDELQAEKRRLLLSKEITLSPAEIKKAAKRVGFVDAPQAERVSMNSSSPSVQKMAVKAIETSRPVNSPTTNKVVPTVMVEPANRPAKQDRQAQLVSVKDRRDRT